MLDYERGDKVRVGISCSIEPPTPSDVPVAHVYVKMNDK
jgi:hypothetical protein